MCLLPSYGMRAVSGSGGGEKGCGGGQASEYEMYLREIYFPFNLTLYAEPPYAFHDMPGCRISAPPTRHWFNLIKPPFAFSFLRKLGFGTSEKGKK